MHSFLAGVMPVFVGGMLIFGVVALVKGISDFNAIWSKDSSEEE